MPSVGTPVQYLDANGKIHPGQVSAVDSTGAVLSIVFWDDVGRSSNNVSSGLSQDDTQETPNSWTVTS